MITRRAALVSGLAAVAGVRAAGTAEPPGAGAATLRVGNTTSRDRPASAWGMFGRAEAAFFQYVNDQGGVGGRRIDFASLDGGHSPPGTVGDVRRLVERDRVAFLFGTLGTACDPAVVDHVNGRRIPHLFLSTGASKWGDHKRWPWRMGWRPSHRAEAQIYAKYILAQVNDPRVAILHQNDDFGRDYLAGVRDVLGADWDRRVAGVASYEAWEPTIDSQVAILAGSGANALVVAATPKFTAQAIRGVRDLGWRPVFFLANTSTSVASVMAPAGAGGGAGIVTAGYLKDPTDPAWAGDAGMGEWRGFMAKHMPSASPDGLAEVAGYGVSLAMLHVLKRCEGDFSRPSVMRQAENLRQLESPVLLPGITLSTSPTDHRPIKAMQLMRWTGRTWDRFGGLIEGSGA